LGQLPLNRELSLIFNPQSDHQRYMIDAGRERKQFAVGDKVMATRNDWEAGITNGMTGIISEIAENAEYAGDRRRFGTVEEVNRYFADHGGSRAR
jgi:ATP-dependent exoDNAse (exonuclease V) alpha subunit